MKHGIGARIGHNVNEICFQTSNCLKEYYSVVFYDTDRARDEMCNQNNGSRHELR